MGLKRRENWSFAGWRDSTAVFDGRQVEFFLLVNRDFGFHKNWSWIPTYHTKIVELFLFWKFNKRFLWDFTKLEDVDLIFILIATKREVVYKKLSSWNCSTKNTLIGMKDAYALPAMNKCRFQKLSQASKLITEANLTTFNTFFFHVFNIYVELKITYWKVHSNCIQLCSFPTS